MERKQKKNQDYHIFFDITSNILHILKAIPDGYSYCSYDNYKLIVWPVHMAHVPHNFAVLLYHWTKKL